ncbi:Protein SDA1-like [Vitis vinifera]|uniref:Protein SDA1 n=1 Tax=Vitis vinifera TaxID=29760 RepID=A0A438J5W2_VITVI|nr:Protein SDA1-like [Vitis vinifera]
MNQKHKNEAQNRALQNILFPMLQQEDEAQAKRSLITLCDLHRRKVWFDDRTANAVYDDDSDGSSSEDETPQKPQVVLSKGDVYKAHHKGTLASKKKKKAKLQRVIRNMKRKQRLSSEKGISNNYSPLNHLKDAQGFSEKLFSRLQTCNERFEKIFLDGDGLVWIFTGVYGPFTRKERESMWEELRAIRGIWDDPWCLGGDFNVTLSQKERSSQGIKWSNEKGVVQSRLSRPTSNHFPILLKGGGLSRGPSQFRFENMWLKVDGFKDLLRDWWQGAGRRGRASFRLTAKMKVLKEKIKV